MGDTVEVMLDIETLGTKPGCAVLSIGAVLFTLNQGIQETYYQTIDLDSCRNAGLKIETNTLLWWLDQSEEARDVFRSKSPELVDVLAAFARWLPEGADIWAHGPTFDISILEAAFSAVGLKEPWHHWQIRDNRTVKKLMVEALSETHNLKPTVAHNALDDAVAQASNLVSFRRALNRLVQPAEFDRAKCA